MDKIRLERVVDELRTLAVKTVTDCTFKKSASYFGVDEYVIGLVCGMGDPTRVDADISCAVVGDQPESIALTVDGNDVTLEFVTE